MASDGHPVQTHVEFGGFPFPLTTEQEESRYLTWVRNHSNYMAERGFLDYLRIAAVLVRGILVNFVTLLPYLLVLGLALAVLHSFMEPNPFILTQGVLAITLVWILLFPVVARLSKVVGYKKSRETGSGTSVKLRDIFERSFGGTLLAILLAAVLESLVLVVEPFHGLEITWQGVLIAGGGVLVVLVGANKLLSGLGGASKKLATLLIALLGLLIPVLVILYVMEFVLYSSQTEPSLTLCLGLLVLPVIVNIGLISAFVLGLYKGTFNFRECVRLVGMLFGLLIGSGLLIAALVWGGVSGFAAGLEAIESGADLPAWSTWQFWVVLGYAVEIWVFCWLAVDVNLTSVHGLYRDRLASAYLVGADTRGEVDIEQDLDLQEICNHEAGSTAPYHLVNVAHNLQGSKDPAIRDRNSDFFVFSKRFIGGKRTGYCRSEMMERVYPQMNLAVAMAISAAAASPNMGRGTSPAMVALMTLLNVRLGFWVPNPGLLEEMRTWKQTDPDERAPDGPPWKNVPRPGTPLGFTFAEVFAEEIEEIKKRWGQVYAKEGERHVKDVPASSSDSPHSARGLVGIGFSGGGIRSATINLGITQALHQHGVFDHVDYMSTVSGGGYLGSSISTLMRHRVRPFSEIDGKVQVSRATDASGKEVTKVAVKAPEGKVSEYAYGPDAAVTVETGESIPAGRRLIARPDRRIRSAIKGTVSSVTQVGTGRVVRVEGPAPGREAREYACSRFDVLRVKKGDAVERGDPLVKYPGSFADVFRWRVRPSAFLREMRMKLDETHRWVNLSDGGHIENLAAIELLRRRCKFIILGDGEADPNLHFNGLATLIRFARIDLGVDIDICLDEIRLDADRRSPRHWAIGRIHYPGEDASECGYLLYLKSSFCGHEDEVIMEYRNSNPAFPHESTADQFFDEGQFEAYRALGQHIAEMALASLAAPVAGRGGRTVKMSYAELASSLAALWESHGKTGCVEGRTDGEAKARPRAKK